MIVGDAWKFRDKKAEKPSPLKNPNGKDLEVEREVFLLDCVGERRELGPHCFTGFV